MEYLAKYNKVWQKVGTDKPLGNKLTLREGEKLTEYEQVPIPKPPKKEPPKESKAKQGNGPSLGEASKEGVL